jgi:hypothetical protein
MLRDKTMHNEPKVGKKKKIVISGFRREGDENCALMGYYAVSSGNSLQTFRANLPSSLNMGSIGCPETSARKQGIIATRCVITEKGEALEEIQEFKC